MPNALPTATKDIWVYAAYKVANKSLLQRVAHSSRFHSLRSAVSSRGSFGSKFLSGLTAVGRGAFNLIPIPIIGSLLSQAESAIEAKFRTYLHSNHVKRATVGDAEYVKFQLKDASVADLDRYRWKVTESVTAMQTAGGTYSDKWYASNNTGNVCDPNVEFALAIAQAERRIDIFTKKCGELKALMEASIAWAEGAQASVVDYKNQARERFLGQARFEQEYMRGNVASGHTEIMALHAHCNSDFCIHKNNKINTTGDRVLSGLAEVVSGLSAPFTADVWLAADHTSFEHGSRVANYDSGRSMNASSNS
jgi:hypothetical protein